MSVTMAAAILAFPLWVTFLQWMSPKTDATSVPAVVVGHMQMTTHPAPTSEDRERAQAILEVARNVVAHYRDVGTAQRDGYKLFVEMPVGQEEHYTNYRNGWIADRRVDLAHPTSLLYRHEPDGSRTIVGVMYTAAAKATAADLDARVPRSIGVWHRHVDFCYPPPRTPADDSRFGFKGSIDDADSCKRAGGAFIPVVFGWMTHVYPDERDPTKIWGGETMQPQVGEHGRGARAMSGM